MHPDGSPRRLVVFVYLAIPWTGWADLSEKPAPVRLPEIQLEEAGLSPLRGDMLGPEILQNAPQRSLDGILQSIPGFHLFRRNDSWVAHPTTQGLSLGNTGPSGSSRTSLLLDGVPMNDPFGGWIPWSRFPAGWLSTVALSPDGVAGLPAAASPGGSLHLESRALLDAPFTLLEAAAGNLLEHQVSGLTAVDIGQGRTRLYGGGFSSDYSGYALVRGATRGLVDVRASSRVRGWDTGLRQKLTPDGEWKLTLRTQGAYETRGNGTPFTRNDSSALDFSARLEREASAQEWSGDWTVFHQRRDFASTFGSVAPDRRSETPSLDQYAVPARATGMVHRLRLPLSERHVLSLGGDLRVLEGETREHFRFTAGAFSRGRVAGGDQQEASLLLSDTWQVSDAFTTTGGVRLRLHRDLSGQLREFDLASLAVLREEAYEERSRAGLDWVWSSTWKPVSGVVLEGAFFSSHRYPTLNELYRPYRVGDTATIANPELRPEVLVGADAAVRWQLRKGLALRGRLFATELRDAVANVSEVKGPGTFPGWGVLPAGTVGARRENLEAIATRGIEAGADAELGAAGVLFLRWMYTGAEVRKAGVAPWLEGLRPAQLPRQQATAVLRGAAGKWRWEGTLRWGSAQFDDDLNQRSLAAACTADARIARRILSRTELFVSLENIGNKKVESRRDPDGTLAYAAPRAFTLGVRSEF